MNPRVRSVQANPDYTLTIEFDSAEIKVFDVKPYLDEGVFRELREMLVFCTVRPFLGSVRWNGGQDFCPDTLYLDAVSVEPRLHGGIAS
jgi:hypothetical protein